MQLPKMKQKRKLFLKVLEHRIVAIICDSKQTPRAQVKMTLLSDYGVAIT